MKYRSEIDGLRALAVVLVILFHAGFKAFSGGFIGVDIFFVISGYLITTILLSDLEAGSFSIAHFYERRARRILPALFLVLLVCLPFAWFWLLPQDLKGFSKSLIAVALFYANFHFWKSSGYFDPATELKPLLHTWSLSVEEQYYVIFPLLLFCVWRLGKRWAFGVLAGFAVLSLIFAQLSVYKNPSFTFYMLPTRGWELIIGALVAFYYSERNIKKHHYWTSELGSLIGLLLIVCSNFTFSENTPFPSLFALAPTIGAALIIVFATNKTLVGKLFSTKPFLWIGLISYSAYLWHQPIFAFARLRGPEELSNLFFAALASSVLPLAYLTWRYVERPFRNRNKFSNKQVIWLGLVGTIFLVNVGLLGKSNNGLENRFPSSILEILSYEKYDYKPFFREGVCFLDPEQKYSTFARECASESSPSVLIWGDSHAAALSFGMQEIFRNLSQYTASGCPPIKDAEISWRPNCVGANNFVLQEIERLKPKQIFLHANWSLYADQNPVGNIHKTIDFIRENSPKTEIFVIGSVPQWSPSLPKIMLKKHLAIGGDMEISNDTLEPLKELDNLLEIETKRLGVTFVSAIDALCAANECLITTNYEGHPTLTAWDYGHLTAGGSVLLAKRLFKNWGSQDRSHLDP